MFKVDISWGLFFFFASEFINFYRLAEFLFFFWLKLTLSTFLLDTLKSDYWPQDLYRNSSLENSSK